MSDFKLQFSNFHLSSKEVKEIFTVDDENSIKLGPFRSILCEKFNRTYDLLVIFENSFTSGRCLSVDLACALKDCKRKYRLVISEWNVFKNSPLAVKVFSNNLLCHHKGILQALRKWQCCKVEVPRKMEVKKIAEKMEVKEDFSVRRIKSECKFEEVTLFLVAFNFFGIFFQPTWMTFVPF